MEDKFWTDEMVKEFVGHYTHINRDNFENFSSILNNFKKSKEQVVNKGWEILSFAGNCFKWNKCEDGRYKTEDNSQPFTFEYLLNTEGVKIHSVKRLSDEDIFCIGDKVRYEPIGCPDHFHNDHEITYLEIDKDNFMRVMGSSPQYFNFPFSKIKKSKSVLFTTEDGLAMYGGEDIFYVGETFEINEWVSHKTEYLYPDKLKYFSTKQAAETYVLENKPLLSVKDVCSLTAKYGLDFVPLEKEISVLAKQKLNQ
jgi:hypothetical protein